MSRDIREATTLDAAALGHLHVECWREAYAHLLSERFLADLDPIERGDRWAGMLAKPRTGERVFVLDVDGELHGFASSGPAHDDDPPRERALYTLYLLKTEYGSGAGQQLLDAVLGDAPAYLWVADENPRATAFYRRNGFMLDGVSKEGPRSERLLELRMVR